MKVLHLITGGDTGGAKTHVLTLLKELNKNIDARLLCIMEGIFTKEAREMGIDVTIIPQRKRYNIFVIKDMVNIIKKENYDIIHCHGARANFLGIFLKYRLDIPIVTTIHSDYRLDFADNKYKHLFYTPINSIALRFISYYIAVTKNFKNMLIDRGFKARDIFEVYNGIYFNKNIKTKDKESFFKKHGIKYNEDITYIGDVSRLHPVKGIDVFLKGAKEISKKYSNVKFLVAGEGTERKQYEEYIKKENLSDVVFLLGHVDDIFSFYKAIDINVLSSYSESFPYALLEGARQKKPTISSKVGGIPEMIIHGECGYLFEAGDHKKLVKYIETLIEDEDLRIKLGNNFYKRAKEKFSVEAMSQKHLDIYEIIKEERS
ncbi:MAG: glycosyltransferase family 4 protein [Firmicutes bacterium]|nr:glycosyltransferase family 4 protein [Bacillota bacterium]